MSYAEIKQQFAQCQSWEARYRLLIQLSRTLPKPDADTLAALPEIHGCESRLWFAFQAEPRQIHAYSDARLMQGLLAIVVAVVAETPSADLKQLDLQAVFNALNIAKHLTSTRLNGLQQIEAIITSSDLPTPPSR